MEASLLVLVALKMAFASSLSVMFGWQPMPDGSPKVEYIVQIEPELLATLQTGLSIPITSDIPDDIGPIGRIRIVVGRDELPRQNIVTHFKPWPGKKTHAGQPHTVQLSEGQPREGLVETQFTVQPVQSSGAGRYSSKASTGPILPPGGSNPSGNSAAVTTNPVNLPLQQEAQQAPTWRADEKLPIFPPTGNRPLADVHLGQNVQNAIDHSATQLSHGLQPQNIGTGPVGSRQPEYKTQPAASPSPASQQNATLSSGNSTWTDWSSTPEIRKHMLDHPVADERQSSNIPQNHQQTAGRPFVEKRPPEMSSSPDPRENRSYDSGRNQSRDLGGNPPQDPGGNRSRDPGENPSRDPGGNQNNANSSHPNEDSSNDKTLFPLLLSWVLLSSSGAVNFYLFWSYRDVCNKYHGLVHSAPSRREK